MFKRDCPRCFYVSACNILLTSFVENSKRTHAELSPGVGAAASNCLWQKQHKPRVDRIFRVVNIAAATHNTPAAPPGQINIEAKAAPRCERLKWIILSYEFIKWYQLCQTHQRPSPCTTALCHHTHTHTQKDTPRLISLRVWKHSKPFHTPEGSVRAARTSFMSVRMCRGITWEFTSPSLCRRFMASITGSSRCICRGAAVKATICMKSVLQRCRKWGEWQERKKWYRKYIPSAKTFFRRHQDSKRVPTIHNSWRS